MFNTAAPTCTRSTCSLGLALSTLLLGTAPAAAQDMQLRAGALAAASRATGSNAALSSSFELNAVKNRVQPAAAGETRAAELAGIDVRLWITQGRADVGVGLGSLSNILPSGDGLRTVAGAVPSVSIGMRYRISDRHLLFADAAAARGLGADPAVTYVSTKLGVEWKPARSTLGFEHGAIGMQLDSGFRLSLKSRRGGPALYLRNSF
jgi:hypothetical protein